MHTHRGECEPEFLGVHFISIFLSLFLSATYTMVEECPRLALIKQELEVALAKNRRLEEEKEQLKQEVAFLKAQARRRSSPVKHLQITNLASDQSQQEKGSKEINLPEEFYSCSYRPSSPDLIAAKNTSPRIPKLPPKPTLPTMVSSPATTCKSKAPPPPPPPPMKLRGGAANAVRRVPEVVELYRLLMRKDARSTDNRTSSTGVPSVARPKNMIGEIENRSTYLLAIKSDAETQGEFINFLAKEVKNAGYTEISDVEAFVKWLDDELSYLIDERAVLKHFPQWPEKKADAMREAACSYRDLKNLESEVSSFLENNKPQFPVATALKRAQALQDKLERSIHNVERTRDSASKRYKDHQIPWDWMLETGIISQLKLCSMRLAKFYILQTSSQLEEDSPTREHEDYFLQGIRFAFRVHQFIGGFNDGTAKAFKQMSTAAAQHSLLGYGQ